MTKILTQSQFVCEICHRIYPTAFQANECQKGHVLIYVPFQREDLKRLVAFINLGEERLLTKSLLETLDRYARLSSEPEPRRANYVPNFDDEVKEG